MRPTAPSLDFEPMTQRSPERPRLAEEHELLFRDVFGQDVPGETVLDFYLRTRSSG